MKKLQVHQVTRLTFLEKKKKKRQFSLNELRSNGYLRELKEPNR